MISIRPTSSFHCAHRAFVPSVRVAGTSDVGATFEGKEALAVGAGFAGAMLLAVLAVPIGLGIVAWKVPASRPYIGGAVVGALASGAVDASKPVATAMVVGGAVAGRMIAGPSKPTPSSATPRALP